MKNPHDILQKKELEVERLRTEIAALHSVISLLVEASDCAEYGLAVPPNVQEIGIGSEALDHLGNRTVIRLRQIKEELSRIMPRRMLKRAA